MSADDLGRRFVGALAAKDADGLTAVLAPDVDFKGLTPRQFWGADTIADVLEIFYGSWFEDQDSIDEVTEIRVGDPVADTHEIGYRFAVSNQDGPHVVGQQAYYRTAGDRIVYLRVVCSGWRPVEG